MPRQLSKSLTCQKIAGRASGKLRDPVNDRLVRRSARSLHPDETLSGPDEPSCIPVAGGRRRALQEPVERNSSERTQRTNCSGRDRKAGSEATLAVEVVEQNLGRVVPVTALPWLQPRSLQRRRGRSIGRQSLTQVIDCETRRLTLRRRKRRWKWIAGV